MVRIGIVGLGGMGKLYLEHFSLISDCDVTTIVEPNVTKNEIEKPGVRLYGKIDEMLAIEELDVACVCTPTYLHREQIEALLRRNIHVITEKPLSLHKHEALDLLALAKQKGVQLYVAQVVRFSFVSRVLKEIVQDKRYGNPLEASFERLSPCPHWIKDGWVFDVKKSGHVPFDLHIHDLDLIVSLFGIPDKHSFTGSGNKDKPYKEHCRFLYNYDGFDVTAEAAWYDVEIPFTVKWRVFFERAVVISDGITVTVYTKESEPYVFEQSVSAVIDTGISVPTTSMYLDELTHFIDCAKRNSPSEVVNNKEVIMVIELLEKMMESTNLESEKQVID